MNKNLIINADDFGISVGVNTAIKKAYNQGVLTSTSLLATGLAYEHAVKIIKSSPDLGVGIHLSLTIGKAVLAKKLIPDLINEQGYFIHDFNNIFIKSFTDPKLLGQIKSEFTAQIEKLLNTGIIIDHLDSQQYVHIIPAIFSIVVNLAKKYKIRFIRIPNEKFYFVSSLSAIFSHYKKMNFIKYILLKMLILKNPPIRNQIKFFGLLYSSHINLSVFKKIITIIPNGFSEVLIHPGQISKIDRKFNQINKMQKIYNFLNSSDRITEFNTLIDPLIKELIISNKLNLTNFKNI